jgi:hypothetical protein
MKKYIFNFTVVALAAVLFFVLNAEKNNTKEKDEKVVIEQEDKKIIGTQKVAIDEDHKYKAIDCKSCHSCEYPTRNNPCLNECPRDDYISVYHSPDEGPTIVEMDEIDGDYGAVVFTHKIHAQMSVMSGGCETCHHYNTTGPVLKCVSCHEDEHMREDISIPELEAAYHRQCITCHRQWSGSTDCDFCHVEKGEDLEAIRKMKMQKYTGLDHPELHEPMKVVYETEHESAPLVTFFHNEHVQLFNIDCASCHHDENCLSCHYTEHNELRSKSTEDRHKHIHKTFEEHHDPCSSCHNIDNCDKCHKTKEMEPFNHTNATGFNLAKYHSEVKCEACHKDNNFKGLSQNCSSCHKFNSENFDHKITGVELDMMHVDFSCSDCHKNNNYSRKPDCSDCHGDDITWPKAVPGKRVK